MAGLFGGLPLDGVFLARFDDDLGFAEGVFELSLTSSADAELQGFCMTKTNIAGEGRGGRGGERSSQELEWTMPVTSHSATRNDASLRSCRPPLLTFSEAWSPAAPPPTLLALVLPGPPLPPPSLFLLRFWEDAAFDGLVGLPEGDKREGQSRRTRREG